MFTAAHNATKEEMLEIIQRAKDKTNCGTDCIAVDDDCFAFEHKSISFNPGFKPLYSSIIQKIELPDFQKKAFQEEADTKKIFKKVAEKSAHAVNQGMKHN